MAITYLSGGRIQGSSAAAGTESDYSQDTGSNDGTGFGNNNVLSERLQVINEIYQQQEYNQKELMMNLNENYSTINMIESRTNMNINKRYKGFEFFNDKHIIDDDFESEIFKYTDFAIIFYDSSSTQKIYTIEMF